MDMMSSAKWLSEFEMEVDPAFNYQYQMNPLDYSIDELDFNSFSSKSYSTSNPPTLNPQITQKLESSPTMERPTKQLKTNSWGSCISDQGNNNITPKASPCSSHIISFDNSNSPAEATYQQFSYGVESTVKPKTNKVGSSTHYGQGCKKSAVVGRTPLHGQDHVIAERKRREKLSQRFIALSAVVPGLKKMDKASVLGEAITYLKQLQERVNVLEEQAAKKTMESVIYVKNSQVYGDDGSSSSDENFDGACDQLTLPKLEARVCGRDVLIRVNCDKQKGCFVRILSEIEKLPLTVINSSTLPFGNATLDITIVAQMENELSVTGKEIVKSLRHALL